MGCYYFPKLHDNRSIIRFAESAVWHPTLNKEEAKQPTTAIGISFHHDFGKGLVDNVHFLLKFRNSVN